LAAEQIHTKSLADANVIDEKIINIQIFLKKICYVQYDIIHRTTESIFWDKYKNYIIYLPIMEYEHII
jgi:hypothetical protein